VRAARAYADLSPADLAARLHVSRDVVWRMEAGRRLPDADERDAIAQACGVPVAFLESGFAGIEDPITDTDRRVLELEARVDERLAAIEAKLGLTETDAGDENNGDTPRGALEEVEQAADEVLRGLESELPPDEESAHGEAT